MGVTGSAWLIGAMLAGSAAIGQQPSPVPGAGPYSAEEQRELDNAMARLDGLVGSWRGEGFVRAARNDAQPATIATLWEIARAFDGRVLRLEFTGVRTSGARMHWVGLFTYDVVADHYSTVWTNAGHGYTFQETGTLDAAGRVLTLVSIQDGEPGQGKIEVRSVFSLVGDDEFAVEDRTPIVGGEPVVTLSCTLKRGTK